MEVIYKNKSRNGLKNNHKYVCKVIPPCHGKYVYDIQFIYDCTDEEEMDLWLQYASEISIKNNFKYERLEIDG